MEATSADNETTRLFRVRRTILQMLHDRGYMVDSSELKMTKQDFINKFGDSSIDRENLNINTAKEGDPSDQISVFFSKEDKVGAKIIKENVELMKSKGLLRVILVAKTCTKLPVQDISMQFNLELFQESELVVNIRKHELVPDHQVLTNEEKEALLEHYTVKETQLPRILMTDPAARYYGLRRGQVVKIIRRSEIAGRYITYRYVI